MSLTLQNRIELVTAPAADVLSLADTKAHMRIEHDNDDTLLFGLINTATAYLDVTGALGKAMINQTWAEWVSPNPSTVTLSLGPVQSVSAVKYYDTNNALQTATLSNFYVLGTSGKTTIKPKPNVTWPTTFQRDDAIKIEYVIGYGASANDVPATVRHAMLMLVAHWYENREAELIGVNSKTLPFGFDDLIGMERATWYG